jgi:hypothetical protein
MTRSYTYIVPLYQKTSRKRSFWELALGGEFIKIDL